MSHVLLIDHRVTLCFVSLLLFNLVYTHDFVKVLCLCPESEALNFLVKVAALVIL